jgi:molybdopterin-binding protein
MGSSPEVFPIKSCFFYYGVVNFRKDKEDTTMKISARNQLKGKIKKITKGAVNSEVTLELADGLEIISIITNSSVNNLGLKEGKEASAIIKASNVMIAVD